ncbi:PKD domain-containing protein [Kitasatospora sp. NPDC002227]|uniref:right-handed parallel beta-helix repeat-containing protein n=1 Tax=Kitasatospora sp. NPDC002227 TaxID=3154773 RepID=UPI00332AAD28
MALGLQLPGVAAAADGSTLYVNNATAAHCSDSGPGSQAQPFCTIQAAADVVQAGQTVEVAHGQYVQPRITLSHSGTPQQPITFRGGRLSDGIQTLAHIVASNTDEQGFVLDGVHDVTLSGFFVHSQGPGAALSGTSRVTLDGNWFFAASNGSPQNILVDGKSSGTTVSHNLIEGYTHGTNVVIAPGSTGTVLSANAVTNSLGTGIEVTGTQGVVLTGNTVSTACAPSVSLLGDSSRAVVENNVLAPSPLLVSWAHDCQQPAPRLAVSAASASGTRADHNLTNPYPHQPAYTWAGADYPNAAAFARAVPGQAGHDLTADPKFDPTGPISGLSLTEGSPAIDAADAAAPGESATDLYGRQRVADPTVPDTGSGNHDLGAFEFSPLSQKLAVAPSSSQTPLGSAVSLTVTPLAGWSGQVSYRYDFGDGIKVTTADLTVSHTYDTMGPHQASVTAVLADGDAGVPTRLTLTATQPGPLDAYFSLTPSDHGLSYYAVVTAHSAWDITGYSFDFGDGSAVCESTVGACNHVYRKEGDLMVTITVKDAGGRTKKLQQVLHANYQDAGYVPLAPARLVDTRQQKTTIGPQQTLSLPVLGRGDVIFGKTPEAVVLNVTAVAKSSGGYLTVFPGGTDRPDTSNVNFAAGQAVPNLVTVPVGADGTVQIFNKFGDTDVVVDIAGYYSVHWGEDSGRFTAQAPVRLLDTRADQPLGPGGETSLQIAGKHGVPWGAKAVVLNVTSTGSDAGGYFTAYPSGTARPGTSNLNFKPGQTVANQVIVPIGSDGSVRLYNFAGHAQAVVDLFGYYSPDGDALFEPVTPRRLLDTRTSSALGPGGTVAVASGAPLLATGAVVNVTAVQPTTPGYLTVWAYSEKRPGTSNLNFLPGQVVPNHVTTPLSSDGAFDVYNFSGTTQVVADLSGWFVK